MKALVVGYGSIGKRHIDNLSTLGKFEILVCTKRKYDNFLKRKKCRIFGSVEDALKEKPDIALVTNVTSRHVKEAKKIAKAGVDLFIEKPLSNSMTEVNTLLDIVKKKKLVSLVGCNLRFHPCIKKIKNIITRNKIGRVISVRVENGSFLPDWHPDEIYQNSYASRANLGGGVVLTCIHEIDYLYWFFGNVKEVFSITGKYSDLDLSAEDLSAILLQFNNKIVGEVHLDYFQRPKFRSCKVIGTKGTIYWDSEINSVKIYDIKKKKWIKKMSLHNYDDNHMYVDEMSHFLKCVKNKQQTLNTMSDGLKVLEVALAVKRSSKTKKGIILN